MGADGFKLSILDDGGADAAGGAGAGAGLAPAAAAASEERLVATVHINRPAGRSKARLSPPIPHPPPPPLPCLTPVRADFGRGCQLCTRVTPARRGGRRSMPWPQTWTTLDARARARQVRRAPGARLVG
jgi:hypothetical protein